jgi:hypothetical protein
MNNGIQIVKLKFRLYVFLYNKDINYMANFTFQTYIVTMLLNVITSTKVNIYILKLDVGIMRLGGTTCLLVGFCFT